MSVGLDIGSQTIKIVELKKEGDKMKLRASGVVGYSGVAPEKMIDEKELVPLADAIRKLHKEAKISSRDVAISLPESQVFTRMIRFPLLSDSEIASAVRWEAEQYIPIPIEEAVIQHQILERREDTNPQHVSILLIAAPKKLVEKYVKLAQLSGLSVTTVETELLSLSRSLAPENQVVVVLDFGSRSTDIAVVKLGKLMVSRSISTAGEAFTRAISQGLGVERRQAEEYKRTYGLSQTQLEGKIKKVLDPIFRIVADEIKKSIHYYQSEEGGEIPRSVILSGGSAQLPEATSYLTQLLDMEVIVGNPFSKLVVDPEAANTLAGYAPLYSIAVGLALREA